MPAASPPTTDAAIETRVFWLRFRNEIIGALIVALLAALGYVGFRVYADRRNAAAADMLAGATTVSDYQQVITRYPDSAASADAYLLLADAQRRESKFADANTTLQTFLSKHPDSELASTARLAIAGNLDATGKTDEALALYQQIATTYPKSYAAPLALISRAHLLKVKNRNDEARQVCEAIMTQYRESFWARDAMQLLFSMKPSTPPAAPAASAGPQPPPFLARPPERVPLPPAPSPGANKPK
jgi:predicted negative regulator of RcsB-dependent stress response